MKKTRSDPKSTAAPRTTPEKVPAAKAPKSGPSTPRHTGLRNDPSQLSRSEPAVESSATRRRQPKRVIPDREIPIRTLFEVDSVGIVQADPRDGRLIRFNERFREITGYSNAELRAMKFPDLTHPEDRQRDWELFSGAARGETPAYRNEKRCMRKDGSVVWVRVNAAFTRSEAGKPVSAMLFSEDITWQKQENAETLRTMKRFEGILESISDGFFCLDHEMVVTHFNSAAERMLNRKKEDVLGRRLFDAFPEARGSIFEEEYARALSEKKSTTFDTYFGAAPYENWYEVRAYPSEEGLTVFFQVITGCRQAEQQIVELNRSLRLRLSELETIFETVPVGIAIAEDPEGRHIRGNPANERVLSIPPGGELSKKAPEGLAPGYRTFRDGREMPVDDLPMQRAVRGETVIGEILTVIRADGSTVELLCNAAPLLDEESRPRGAVGAFQDITPLRRAEEALRQSETKFRSALANAAIGLAITKPDGTFVDANPAYCAITGYDIGELRRLKFHDLLHSDDLAGTLRLIGRMHAGDIPDFRIENRYVRKDGAVVWVRKSVSPVRDARGAPEWIIALVEDVTERKEAEEKLRYQAELLDRVSDAVISTDPGFFIRSWNKAAERTYGWKATEAIGRQVDELLRTKFVSLTREEAAAQLLAGGTAEVEALHFDRHGNEIYVKCNVSLLRDADGNVTGTLGVMRNVTARRRAEEALQEDRQRLDLALRASGAAAWGWDVIENRLDEWTPEYRQIYGFGDDQPADFGTWLARVHPEDRHRLTNRVRQVIETPGDDVWHEEFRILHPERGERWLGGLGRCYRDESGRAVRVAGVNLDITDRKKAEEALRASEQRMQQALLASHSFTFEWQPETDRVLRSASCERILELTGDEIRNDTGQRFFERVHPDDRPRFLRTLRGLTPAASSYMIEYRVVRGDGEVAVLEESARGTFDADGRLRRLIGVTTDVTERKLAQQAVHESEERLRFALETSNTGAWDLDLAAHTAVRSPVHDRIFGYDRLLPQWTYEMFLDHVLPEDRAAVDAKFRHALETRTDWSFECRIRRADGQVRWISAAGQHRADASGLPRRMAGVVQDITDRKEAEEALRWTSRRNELLSNTAARLLETDDPRGLIDELCRQVMEFLECQVFFNYLEEEGRLHLNACAGIPEEEARKITCLDYGVAVCGYVARGGAPIIAEDILNSPEPRTELVKSYGVQAYCCHPLKIENRVIGTLSFGSRTRPRFTDEQIGVMRTVTDLVAVAMHRIKTQKALQQSERLYRAIGESIDYGIWVCAPDGRNIYASESFLNLVGITQQQCSDFGWGDVLHPDDVERTIAAWKECVRTGGTWDIEHRFRGVDGRWHPILARGVPVRDEQGQVICWAGINLDMRRLKEAEDALLRSREDLHRAQAVGQIGWWRLDTRRNVLTWSDENHRIFGVPKGTPLTYGTFLEAVHPDDRQYVDMMWQAALRGEPYDIEHRIMAEGQVKWVREKAYLEFDEAGALRGGFGITQDITTRKESEEALRKNEKELRSARKALQEANEELERRIGERTEQLQKANRALERGTYDLNQRVKELNCLYIVSHLLTEEDVPLEEVLREVVSMIPSALQFPDIAGACIVLNGLEVKTHSFRDTPWKLHRPIRMRGSDPGQIEIAYREEPPPQDDGPFLKEEGVLVGTLAELIGDFMDRLRSKTMLGESEARYRRISQQFHALFDAIPDMLALVSADLKILWANTAAGARSGLTPEDIAGQTCDTLWAGPAMSGDASPARACFESGQRRTARFGTLGSTIWDVMAIPVKDETGTVRNVILSARDVTAELRLQEEAVRSARLASLGELAAGVAHEINNPVNSVINYAQILANRAGRSSQVHEFAGEIISEGERIAAIVRGLLGYARDARNVKLPVTLHSILEATLVLTNAQLKRDGIRLRVDAPDDLPLIRANQQQLQQVFMNLISNARYALNKKYDGPHQDKILEITGERRTVDGSPSLRVRVRDHGTGIPKDLLNKVLSPFFTTKAPAEGTGLGLSLCSSILADHGGSLALESVEGHWTSVIIDLPAEAPEETP